MVKKSDHIVDAVITWVDGNDPKHKAKIQHYLKDKSSLNSKTLNMRFNQINEIEFSVKSILKYAKFVRNIFIVTDNQTPDFLKNKEFASKYYPTVSIVDHKIIFKGYHHYLPTFNCLPIESLLYKIPNLAEHFLYFNDDLFLANKTKLEDFFIDGKPVIRGSWTSFYEDIWYKKVQIYLYKFLGKKDKSKLYGYKKGQQTIAKILGFKKYVKLDHTVSALRKSTYTDYYNNHPEMLERNIKHRFRHYEQYTNQSLANHLEIVKDHYKHQKDYQLVYFQNYKKPLWWLMYKFNKIEKNENIKFLCLQSLDQCPNNKLEVIKKWLHNRYN